MSWIEVIAYDKSNAKLRKVYDRVKSKDNYIDNVLKVHSLRPHTLTGHMALYKNVLHHPDNSLPKWYLETIGVLVSQINACDYCVRHHLAGLKRLIGDEADQIIEHMKNDSMDEYFEDMYLLGIRYAIKLTRTPKEIGEMDIDILRVAGFTDGEILEINQVTSYFNYVNRLVQGLGVNLDGDVLGLSPSESEEDQWNHY